MPFTPIQTFLGGLLLHVSTSSLLTDTGRVFGISSVLDGALLGDHARWRWAILAGLLSGPAVIAATGLAPALPDAGSWTWAAQPLSRLALAGALVGAGSKLGSGCTSGHFLCGVSRLSPRSLIATATFFVTAVLSAKIFPSTLTDTLPAYKPTYPPSSALPALGALVVAAVLAKDLLAALLPRALRQTPETRPVSSTATQTPSSWLTALPYLLSGLTFSLGLVVSGMISPLKVTGFLRLPPPADAWDPSLALVVAGGVIPNAVHWYFLTSSSETPTPKLPWESWQVPSRKDVDWRLVVGAVLFGAGWGLGGVCPGPAIVTLGQLGVNALTGGVGEALTAAATGWAAFAANVLLGMGAVRVFDKVFA